MICQRMSAAPPIHPRIVVSARASDDAVGRPPLVTSRMTASRIILVVTVGCVLALSAIPVVLIALLVFAPRPAYDRAHPDYVVFAERFAEARRELEHRPEAVIDLASLNQGSWRTACLFGGYTRPVEHMIALGAVVTQADRNRLAEPIGLRLSPVEEFEILIAFIDHEGRAHFVHFSDGVGAEGQHYQACATKPATKLVFGEKIKIGTVFTTSNPEAAQPSAGPR